MILFSEFRSVIWVNLTVMLMKQDIAAFFLDAVNSSHTYATGGTSVSEFWYYIF
jgi:hypothetical protein